MRVLFICGGNVGRSQIAEAFFNHYSKKHKARSCAGYDFKQKVLSEKNTSIMKKEYGIDMSKQKPKPFSKKMVEQSDKIIILCNQSECPLIPHADHWSIPKMGELKIKERKKVIGLIQQKVKELLKEIGD